MVNILINDIVPIIVIMALGYICGKFSYFDDDQRQGLNKVVLNIALPAALFVSIIKATREMLAQDATLTAIGFIGVIVMFMVCYYLCRLLFHRSIQEAAVSALIAGSPTIGFLGFAVLDPIYGDTVSTNLVIAIISIVVNAVTIPIGMYLINLGQAKDRAKLSAETVVDAKGDVTVDPSKDAKADKTAELLVHGSSNAGKNKNGNLQALLNALKQPVCWAPLLVIILVLLGVHVPDQVAPTFDLIAKANSGVAVLAAGLALSTVKFSLGWETIWNTFFRLILTPGRVPGRGSAMWHGRRHRQDLHAGHGGGIAAGILRNHHFQPLQHLCQGRRFDHGRFDRRVRSHLPAVDLARTVLRALNRFHRFDEPCTERCGAFCCMCEQRA